MNTGGQVSKKLSRLISQVKRLDLDDPTRGRTWAIVASDCASLAGCFREGSKERTALEDAAQRAAYLSSPGYVDWEFEYREGVLQDLLVVRHRLGQGEAQLAADAEPNQELRELLVLAGTPHSAYVKLRDSLKEARERVLVVDRYLDSTIFPLLKNLAPGVSVRLLTISGKLPADFALELSLFSAERSDLRIAVRCGLTDFHDRFLVVDDKVYFSGASFKHLGRKVSVIARLEDTAGRVLSELEERWQSAHPFPFQ